MNAKEKYEALTIKIRGIYFLALANMPGEDHPKDPVVDSSNAGEMFVYGTIMNEIRYLNSEDCKDNGAELSWEDKYDKLVGHLNAFYRVNQKNEMLEKNPDDILIQNFQKGSTYAIQVLLEAAEEVSNYN